MIYSQLSLLRFSIGMLPSLDEASLFVCLARVFCVQVGILICLWYFVAKIISLSLSLSLSLSCVCVGEAHLCWRFELRQLWGWFERIFWNVWQGKKQLSLSLSFLFSSYSFLYFPMNYNILSLTPTLLPDTAHKLKITRISLLYIYLELIFSSHFLPLSLGCGVSTYVRQKHQSTQR